VKSVCVFTGSSRGSRDEYANAARELGRVLVERDVTLVFGGGNVGLMGFLSDEVMARGGRAIGVIPESLVAKEVAHAGLTELRVVRSMHERKAMMAELSDAFVAMPGGMGTLDEFFEILTWAQLGLHRKPCGMLNVGGYFDGLLAFLDHSVDERFVRKEHRDMIAVETSPAALLDELARHKPPVVEKWIERATS